MDVIPPGGTTDPHTCLPNGRILSTTVTLDSAGASQGSFDKLANVFADTGFIGDGLVEFSCSDHAGAVGKTYTLYAVVDVNADDLASCSPFVNTLTCFNALADDDTDDPDNGPVQRNSPRVKQP